MHRNDYEHIVTIIPVSLVTGLIHPYPTIAFLATYFLGRQLYTWGYFEKEGALNNKRMIGSGLCNVAHIGILGLAVVTAVVLRRGKLIA